MARGGDSSKNVTMWGNFSAGRKIFLGLGFILSCLSVTSLVDGLFQFRGFIVDLIEFYRIPVKHLIAALRGSWGLTVNPSTVDMFVLNSSLAVSFSMALDVFFKAGFTRYFLIVVYVGSVTFLDYQDWSLGDAPRPDKLPYYFYAVLLASFFLSGFLIPGKTQQARQTASIHRSAVAYILAIILLVAVIALVSGVLAGPR